jgi:S1-C subfamily serine protease
MNCAPRRPARALAVLGFLLALLALLATPAAAQKIYRWVDAQGRVQFTQTPPPGEQDAPEHAVAREAALDPAGRADYCAAVRRYAERVGDAMNQGAPREQAIASARTIESQLSGHLDEPAIQEVVNYIWTFRGSRRSGLEIADLVHTRCLHGNFGRLRSTGVDTRSEADTEANPPPTRGRRGGSGFVLGARVATNHHVIEGARRITVYFADGRSAAARVEASDARRDLAVLSVEGRLPRGLPLATEEAAMGAEVFTLGFPLTGLMGANAKLSTGIVSSRTGLRDDPHSYQVSVPVQAGNSGGPLLNRRGEVVGVITSKLAADQVYRSTGDLPQNVNYAVKADGLRPLLSGPSGDPLPAEADGLEALVARVGPAVVRIEVE